MKTQMKTSLFLICSLIVLSITSCRKADLHPTTIRLINLHPTINEMNIVMNRKQLNYFPVNIKSDIYILRPGKNRIEIQDASNTKTIVEDVKELKPNMNYMVYVFTKAGVLNYIIDENPRIMDKNRNPLAAIFKIVHTADLNKKLSISFDNTSTFASIGNDVSINNYYLKTGTYDVNIKDDSTNTIIYTIPQVNFEVGKSYILYTSGELSATTNKFKANLMENIE